MRATFLAGHFLSYVHHVQSVTDKRHNSGGRIDCFGPCIDRLSLIYLKAGRRGEEGSGLGSERSDNDSVGILVLLKRRLPLLWVVFILHPID